MNNNYIDATEQPRVVSEAGEEAAKVPQNVKEKELGLEPIPTATVSRPQKEKNFMPDYSDERKVQLTAETNVCKNELQRVLSDSRYAAMSIENGKNLIVNLKTAHQKGINFGTPVVNRTHGRDLDKTGKSIMMYGAQHPALIITYKMAKAAGIAVTSFTDDGEKVPEDALIILDANGRVRFLLSFPVSEWPDYFYGIFPCPGKSGLYDLKKVLSEINIQVSVWKTQDHVSKRLLEEDKNCPEGFRLIDELVKKGYHYQAACQLVTLRKDRILKSTINKADCTEIFKFIEPAKKILTTLIEKFGEETKTPLKTKEFTKELSRLWEGRKDEVGTEKATEEFVDFISKLDQETVVHIKDAKADKAQRQSKDDVRLSIIDKQYKQYFNKQDDYERQ